MGTKTGSGVEVGQIRVNPFDGMRLVVLEWFFIDVTATMRFKVAAQADPDGPFGWVDLEVLKGWEEVPAPEAQS